MKKCKWLFAILSLVGIIMTANVPSVNAETYSGQAIWPSEYISGIYVRKYGDPSGVIHYKQMKFIRRSEDNKFVYCLQPYVEIDNHYVYNVERSDYTTVTGLSKEQWERVSLLAYYGYGYEGHSAHKWYAITQLLIWRTTTPSGTFVFTDGLNGPDNYNLYASEIAELEALVANHKKTPQFDQSNITIPLGSSITVNDTSGVLSNYTVTSSTGVSATKNGNSLTITANTIGDASITLTKTDTKYDMPPVVYFSPYSQNVFRVGAYDPVTTKIDIKVLGGKVTIHKLDRDTGEAIPSGNAGATLGGAKFGIYDAETNELLDTVVTGSDGSVTSNILKKIGKMYALELESSEGYLINGEKIFFEITEDNLNPSITVYEQIKKQVVEISKFYSQSETGILTPEVGIEFGFYNPNNELVAIIKTDSRGWGQVVMSYGDYTVRQLNSLPNMEKIKDFNVSIRENSSESLKYSIVNEELSAKLKLVKVDSESNKVLVRDGIKFKIKNLDTNEYVCQTITYPTQEKVCVFETNDGVFVTPYVLKAGNYQIEELEDQTIEGYVWNSIPLKFSINDSSNFIYDDEFGIMLEVQFTNKQVKGEFEVNKIGEDFKIEDNKFVYAEKPLDNVDFELYADGDIYSQDGTLIYKDKELVKSFETENGKYVITDLFLGKYCLYEKTTDENHILSDEPYCFEIKYVDQYTETVKLSHTFKNYLKKADLVFSKLDFSTSEAIPNTTIEIYMETENGDILVGAYITDENGNVVIDDMPVIKNTRFYILEKNPADGYVLNEEKMYFSFNENGEVVKSTMLNEKIKSTIKILKVDEEGNTLAGVKIGIYDLEGNEIGIYTTNEFGEIEVELEYNDYMYKEIETLEQFVLDETERYFSVTTDGEIIELEMINEKITSTIKIIKVDENGNTLAGVKIGIYDLEGNEIGIYTTNEFGEIEVELEFNDYMYKELEALEGFVLDENEYYFSVTKNDEVIELKLVNELIEIEVPNTSSNSYIILIPIAMLATGTILLFINNKRKKVKNEKNR